MADRTTHRTEALPDGQILSPTSGDTLSQTATERLLEAGGAGVYVLSKDNELVATITVAARGRMPVHVIWSFRELRGHVERGECKVILLDADLFEGSLRSWIEELCALEPTLVVLVAAPRQAEKNATELLTQRLVHRILIKPATVDISRTLLDAAMSRYVQARDEAARSPTPRNELLALREAAARSAPIRAPRRGPVAKSKTYWPAWFLPIGLAVTVAIGVYLGDFGSLELGGPSGGNADEPEPAFAEPIDSEAPPVDQVVGRPEDAFLPNQTVAATAPETDEAPPEAPPEPPATRAVASDRPAVDDAAALAESTAESSAASPPVGDVDAETAAVVGPPAQAPVAPAPTAPPELESVLAAAWSRMRENQLLAPPGDSARDHVARAAELAPGHPDVTAIQLLLADAVAESARAALESGDLEGAETLAAEALRLGAADETLAVLDLDLAAAREVAARRAHSDLFELSVARLREDRLIAPANDNALDYLRRLRAENPNYPGLDLGVQMGLNSTLCSYLDKLLWLLTANFGTYGSQYVPTAMQGLLNTGGARTERRSPVVGAPIIAGLVPCNVIAEEILTDHPDRYRAMLVESANPAHSLADSRRMREALEALEFVVVIDVAMTETAQLADYVLPASSQFEKAECTFFNFEFPHNYFHLRHPVVAPMEGTLPEPEIHARIVEALGTLDDLDLTPLATAATDSREAFGAAFLDVMAANQELARLAPVILYRTLGPTLPEGLASAAVLWGAAHRCAMSNRPSLERAGFSGEGTELGEALFDAIVDSPSGVTFSIDEYEDSWARVRTPGGLFNLDIEPMLEALAALATTAPPGSDPEFPLVLSAGERRSFTANTIFRDPSWRKRDPAGSLRISAADAAAIGLADGDTALLTTKRGTAEVVVEIHDAMRAGHLSLPNGLGVTQLPGGRPVGVAPNELTSSDHRDPIAGTPYHKHVPARLERLRS